MSNPIDRLYRRILMMVTPVRITATDDTGPVHRAQVRVTTTNEPIDNVPVSLTYGLASHAPIGTDAVAIFLHGNRSAPMIVATGNQKARMKDLKPGEVGLYTDQGDSIVIQRGGTILIKAATKVRIETPRLEVTGDIIDHCDQQSHTMADHRSIYNSHTHRGVQAGTGNSGIPNQPQVTE